MRVQIPAYTDRWMMGDRYGEVVRQKTVKDAGRKVVAYVVQLDKSGKRIAVAADDCVEV